MHCDWLLLSHLAHALSHMAHSFSLATTLSPGTCFFFWYLFLLWLILAPWLLFSPFARSSSLAIALSPVSYFLTGYFSLSIVLSHSCHIHLIIGTFYLRDNDVTDVLNIYDAFSITISNQQTI